MINSPHGSAARIEHIHPLPSAGAPGGARVATQLGLKPRRRVTSPKLHLAVVKLSESSREKHSRVVTNARLHTFGIQYHEHDREQSFPPLAASVALLPSATRGSGNL